MAAAFEARRVLVVDDDLDLLEVYSAILGEEGYEVMTASSGEEAVQLAEMFRPELVITDLNMPGMSGLELMSYFKNQYPLPCPPLITVSGFELGKRESEHHGVKLFLKKPVGLEELVTAVHAVLEGEPVRGDGQFEQTCVEHRSMARTIAARAGQALLGDPLVTRRMEKLVCLVANYFGADAFLLCPREAGLFIEFTSAPERWPRNQKGNGLVALAEDVIESGASLILPDARAAARATGATSLPPLASLAMSRCMLEDIPVGALCLGSERPLSFEGNDLSILELLARSLRTDTDIQSLRKPTMHTSGLLSRGTLRSILQLELETAAKKGESISLMAVETNKDWPELREKLVRRLLQARTILAQLRTQWIVICHRGSAEAVRQSGLSGLRVLADEQLLHAAARIVLDAPSGAHSALGLGAWLKEMLGSALEGPAGTILTFEGKLEITRLR